MESTLYPHGLPPYRKPTRCQRIVPSPPAMVSCCRGSRISASSSPAGPAGDSRERFLPTACRKFHRHWAHGFSIFHDASPLQEIHAERFLDCSGPGPGLQTGRLPESRGAFRRLFVWEPSPVPLRFNFRESRAPAGWGWGFENLPQRYIQPGMDRLLQHITTEGRSDPPPAAADGWIYPDRSSGDRLSDGHAVTISPAPRPAPPA